MTYKDTFIIFCKRHKMLASLMHNFERLKPKKSIYNPNNRSYYYKDMHFDEYFKMLNDNAYIDGQTTFFKKFLFNYSEINRKWAYFKKKNIQYDKMDLKIGDEVEYDSYGSIRNGKVLKIDFINNRILLERGGHISISTIISINGKQFKPFYYLKLNGKEYGIDK